MVLRAGLSSLPLAALVWDIGQMSVDLANEKVTAKFLENLAEKVERIEQSTGDRKAPHMLGDAAAYVARESLSRLSLETSEAFAADLARAVFELESADAEDEEVRRQYARLVAAVGKRDLVYLSAIFRMNTNKATEKEVHLLSQLEPSPQFSGPDRADFDWNNAMIHILTHHMPSLDPESILVDLTRLGLIRAPTFRVTGQQRPSQSDLPFRVTSLGEAVLALFFADVSAVPSYSQLA